MAPSATKNSILVLHGPNLNLLGTREPGIYGVVTLADINQRLAAISDAVGVSLQTFQSNHEGALVDRLHEAKDGQVGFIIINPAAYTHTSVALRDALAALAVPFIEVHLSNVHRREPFRHHSYFSDIAEAVVAGMGPFGYEAALQFALERIARTGNAAEVRQEESGSPKAG